MNEISIKFIYNGQEVKIQCQKNELIKDILQRYLTKIQKNQTDLYFLYNGNILDDNTKLSTINSASNEPVILVCDAKDTNTHPNEEEKSIKYFKDLICPKCGDSSIISFTNYKINLISCDKGHETKNISLKDFKDLQKLDEAVILCKQCQRKKLDTFGQKFYICCNCEITLCPLCKSVHNKDHIILDYESKKYLCQKHGEKFISFCNQCKRNLCDLCGLEHNKNHNLIYHRDIIDKAKITNLSQLRNKIDTLKNEIDNIIIELNEFINRLESYYDISNNLMKNFNINKPFQKIIKIIKC